MTSRGPKQEIFFLFLLFFFNFLSFNNKKNIKNSKLNLYIKSKISVYSILRKYKQNKKTQITLSYSILRKYKQNKKTQITLS